MLFGNCYRFMKVVYLSMFCFINIKKFLDYFFIGIFYMIIFIFKYLCIKDVKEVEFVLCIFWVLYIYVSKV